MINSKNAGGYPVANPEMFRSAAPEGNRERSIHAYEHAARLGDTLKIWHEIQPATMTTPYFSPPGTLMSIASFYKRDFETRRGNPDLPASRVTKTLLGYLSDNPGERAAAVIAGAKDVVDARLTEAQNKGKVFRGGAYSITEGAYISACVEQERVEKSKSENIRAMQTLVTEGTRAAWHNTAGIPAMGVAVMHLLQAQEAFSANIETEPANCNLVVVDQAGDFRLVPNFGAAEMFTTQLRTLTFEWVRMQGFDTIAEGVLHEGYGLFEDYDNEGFLSGFLQEIELIREDYAEYLKGDEGWLAEARSRTAKVFGIKDPGRIDAFLQGINEGVGFKEIIEAMCNAQKVNIVMGPNNGGKSKLIEKLIEFADKPAFHSQQDFPLNLILTIMHCRNAGKEFIENALCIEEATPVLTPNSTDSRTLLGALGMSDSLIRNLVKTMGTTREHFMLMVKKLSKSGYLGESALGRLVNRLDSVGAEIYPIKRSESLELDGAFSAVERYAGPQEQFVPKVTEVRDGKGLLVTKVIEVPLTELVDFDLAVETDPKELALKSEIRPAEWKKFKLKDSINARFGNFLKALPKPLVVAAMAAVFFDVPFYPLAFDFTGFRADVNMSDNPERLYSAVAAHNMGIRILRGQARKDMAPHKKSDKTFSTKGLAKSLLAGTQIPGVGKIMELASDIETVYPGNPFAKGVAHFLYKMCLIQYERENYHPIEEV